MQNNSCHNDTCFSVISCGKDVNINSNDCEIQVDITAQRMKSVVVWGHVVDCHNNPIANALVKLLQYMDVCTGELRSVCYTYTDCKGFYQLDLASCNEGRYRIMVSKAACNDEKDEKKCYSRQGHDEQDSQRNASSCETNAHPATVYCQPRMNPQDYCGVKPNNVYYY